MSDLIERLNNRIAYLEATMRDVSAMLKVPAAEYVPAMGDAFALLDHALKAREAIKKEDGGE
jgi:hypothetical protein